MLPPAATLEQVLVDPTLKTRLVNLCQRWFSQPPAGRQPFVFYFQGPYGVGNADLALGLCAQWGRPLLYVDMELLLAREPDVATALRLVCREGLLWDAAVYLDHGDMSLQEDVKAKAWMQTLARLVDEYGQLTFLAGELPWSLRGVFAQDTSAPWNWPCPMCLCGKPRGSVPSSVSPRILDRPGLRNWRVSFV